MGLRPIVLERGKRVRERTRDTWGLWRRGVLDPDSNVQFGEGGAGTFSDGKLWSQISDARHLTRKVLTEFVKAGAPEEILYVSKPHIGTFRLVSVVEKMRAEIEALGGEIRFGHRLLDLRIADGQLQAVTIAHSGAPQGEEWAAQVMVLAPGHSARETFATLYGRGVFMEAKPFSVGFRVEHPQSLIDRARYGRLAGHHLLGAADYRLVHHARNGRSVYSFCMCPGGTVVAATSEPGHVVTNGMSQYSRAERNANAGIVVGITPQDYARRPDARHGGRVHPLDGIEFQQTLERRAYELGEGDYHAPAQLVGDFLEGTGLVDVRQSAAFIPTRRAVGRSGAARPQQPSRVRHRGDPRGDAGIRPADRRIRDGGRRIHRRRNENLVTAASYARSKHAECQRTRPVSGGRRRGLCRRHHVGGRGWDRSGRGGRTRAARARANAASVDVEPSDSRSSRQARVRKRP